MSLVRSLFVKLLFVTLSACARPHAGPVTTPPSFSYEVDAPANGSRIVTVEATFRGAKTARLAFGTSSRFPSDVVVKNAGGSFRTVARHGDEWIEPSCIEQCVVRYRIDLDALAETCGDDVACARRIGDATLSPSLAWLMYPVPRGDAPVRVTVHPHDPAQFASGMKAVDPHGTAYAFRAFDLDEGSFSAFGPMRKSDLGFAAATSTRLARMHVVILGDRYAMGDEELERCIGDAGDAVASLYGGFPVDHSTVFVLPSKGEREVVFGKVLSLAGASVVVVMGDEMRASACRQDSILVHELLHLGFPTFRGEGRWLGEGLATYYAAIVRARAGWDTGEETFRVLARNLPRGLARHHPGVGLAAHHDIDSIYWGGALFAFAADVRIREATHGQKSLDDVLHAVLARGGDATRVWAVRDVMRVGDEVTGTNVLSQLFEHFVVQGEAVDLDRLMASLGVRRSASGGITFDEKSPLARHRHAIVARPPSHEAVARRSTSS